MSGMEFMEKMQQNDVFKHIPVIMQTAAGEIPEIIEGSQTGIYYYMTKPYSEELLLSVLRSAYKDKEDGKTISESLEKTLGNTNSTEAT